MLSDELRDLESACDVLTSLHRVIEGDLLTAVTARAWLTHAVQRLQERADRWIRGGIALPSSERTALMIIHGTAEELRTAGQALGAAADALRAAGSILPASKAKQASTKALLAAQGLVHA